MSDEIKNEALQVLDETPVETQPEVVQEAPKETQAQLNFKALREEKERMARERDDAIRYAREVEARAYANQQKPPVEVDELASMRPDDLVEAKHFQKKIHKLEEQIQSIQQQSQVGIVEATLKAKYSDFDSVVSKANLDALQEQYPDIHKTIYTSQDLYSKGSAAYQLIKKFIAEPAAPSGPSLESKQLQKNAEKPRSLNTVKSAQPDTPLSRANMYAEGLTEDMKKEIFKHMQAHASKKQIKFTPIG